MESEDGMRRQKQTHDVTERLQVRLYYHPNALAKRHNLEVLPNPEGLSFKEMLQRM